MHFNEALNVQSLLISGYGEGQFRIGEDKYEGNISLTTSECFKWNIDTFEDMTIESLEPFFKKELGVEILLFGTGEKIKFVPREVQDYLKAKKIAFDMMDTGAACRTFNVLQMESRRVAAALIAVD